MNLQYLCSAHFLVRPWLCDGKTLPNDRGFIPSDFLLGHLLLYKIT